MSPKSLLFLLAVGLCATQMVSAHREARGIADFFDTAKNKLSQLLFNAEDSTMSSINTVKEYIYKLESVALESGTNALNRAGIEINLTDLAALLKDDVKVCAQDESVKANAKLILNDIASCVTEPVGSLKSLIDDMTDLWGTARSMPSAIKDVASSCNSEDAVPEEPLPLELTVTLDTSDHELADATNQLLQDASQHLSRRALWDLSRMTRCAKTVFDYAQNDLVTIPGEIITAATHAYQIVQAVQGGIPACVTKKATENVDEISKLGLQIGACVAAGVADTSDAELATNAALKALPGAARTAANAFNTIQDSPALSAVGHLTQFLG